MLQLVPNLKFSHKAIEDQKNSTLYLTYGYYKLQFIGKGEYITIDSFDSWDGSLLYSNIVKDGIYFEIGGNRICWVTLNMQRKVNMGNWQQNTHVEEDKPTNKQTTINVMVLIQYGWWISMAGMIRKRKYWMGHVMSQSWQNRPISFKVKFG